MIVFIIDKDSIPIFKFKGHTPVSTNPYRPSAFRIAHKRMQIVPRQVHIPWARRGIEAVQYSTKPCSMLGYNASPGSVLEKLTQTFMPERFDQVFSVTPRVT